MSDLKDALRSWPVLTVLVMIACGAVYGWHKHRVLQQERWQNSVSSILAPLKAEPEQKTETIPIGVVSPAATPVVTPVPTATPKPVVVKERWARLKAAGFRMDSFSPISTASK